MTAVDTTARRLWVFKQGLGNPATREWAARQLRALRRNEALPASVRAAATTALREAGIGGVVSIEHLGGIS